MNNREYWNAKNEKGWSWIVEDTTEAEDDDSYTSSTPPPQDFKQIVTSRLRDKKLDTTQLDEYFAQGTWPLPLHLAMDIFACRPGQLNMSLPTKGCIFPSSHDDIQQEVDYSREMKYSKEIVDAYHRLRTVDPRVRLDMDHTYACIMRYCRMKRDKLSSCMKVACCFYFVHYMRYVWVGGDMKYTFKNCYNLARYMSTLDIAFFNRPLGSSLLYDAAKLFFATDGLTPYTFWNFKRLCFADVCSAYILPRSLSHVTFPGKVDNFSQLTFRKFEVDDMPKDHKPLSNTDIIYQTLIMSCSETFNPSLAAYIIPRIGATHKRLLKDPREPMYVLAEGTKPDRYVEPLMKCIKVRHSGEQLELSTLGGVESETQDSILDVHLFVRFIIFVMFYCSNQRWG